jgi:hypothetical protein
MNIPGYPRRQQNVDGPSVPAEGVFVGTLKGFAPHPERPRTDSIPTTHEPPEHEQAGRYWYNLQAWRELNRDDAECWIICFACNGLWTGWEYKIVNDKPYTLPVYEGGIITHRGQGYACPCSLGDLRMGQTDVKRASLKLAQHAVEKDFRLQLSCVGNPHKHA